MGKKIILYGLSAIVLFSIVAMMIPISAQVQMADEFGVEDALGNPNTYVDVPVYITNTTYAIIGIEFNIVYDSTVINLSGIEFGDLTSTCWGKTLGGTAGANVIMLDTAPDNPIGIGESGSVVLLNFSVGNVPGYSSPMNISDVKLVDTSIPPQKGTAPAKNGTFNPGPYLVTYTISNRTIIPPQTTSIDVEFSEEVSWSIAIQKDATTVYDWTGTSKNQTPKVWSGTYEVNGTVVPAGDYRVNVTGTNSTTGLSVVNNTEIIRVDTVPIAISDFKVSDGTRGDFIVAVVNVTNDGGTELNLLVVVSGLKVEGYPLAGITTVLGLEGHGDISIPIWVPIPAGAATDDYDLYADVWIDEDYPDPTKAVSNGPEVATVT
jgi:hypothetical protein